MTGLRSIVSLWRAGALAAGLALALVAAAAAQQETEEASPPPAEEQSAEPLEDLGAGVSDLGDIDEILEGDEEALGGVGYTYDPGDRRDPFKSLLRARDRIQLRGPRPEGIPGLLIDELILTGIFKTERGWVGQVQAGNRQKSYLLKEGDQLYDGDVVAIADNEVVFKQIVQDPTALKPFREVVKKLNP